MFIVLPTYSAALTSENRIVNLDAIEQAKPHADVPVEPGAVNTSACELVTRSGAAVIVLLSLGTIQENLSALSGRIDALGQLT